MKRILALALLLALLAALFSACAQSEPEKKPDDDQNGGNQTPVSEPSSESAEPSTESVVDFEPDPDPLPTEPPVETGELITDAISEEMSTEGGYYSLHVPKINLDSADAQRVNQEIMDDFGATAQETLQMRSEGIDASCYEISWDLCWYENTFALIVQKYFEGDYVYHMVYNFDYATGSQLSFEDLLAAAGFTEERFHTTLREAAEAKFREIWPKEAETQSPDVYAQMLEWTISDENILNCRKVFRSEAGDLMVILEIGSLAGAMAYEQIFPLAMG